MILLDTNIVSELWRRTPAPTVVDWLDAQDGGEVYLSAVTEAELRLGIAVMPDGRRRAALAAMVDAMLRDDFQGRILPFDTSAAVAYAVIAAARRAIGRPISQFDCQIAAIARANGAAVATRNVRDFEGCGISVIDPWQGLWPTP
ncbi:VapC toxin family PIN domain ribonuclease [Rhodothalassium salexigens]|uniref:type II toxin-antitoxin system VapC family toxin n=1 Tax=Rhodothalassium salexigens TaxID=1086 RepID=UPI0019127795|nr:type II toxin-antitoxin system VapC family toxin [Rhodothalassium salexigens]MBK5910404.1 VapC toxin family PIN domain ribonuclease [Rhodothalassium salexigens]MBK5919521.1 VapC toxin family PIN domain ribonuclease [Rhodothalassium salexigens]